MEEPTYVDNFFSTRRYRHPFRALDRSFRLFDWRLVDKNHTYGAIIALCLRIGIDPPDITKPEVCAKLEAWADPFAEPAMAALSRIAQNLQKQYEFLHQNLRTKLLTDPTIEDTKRYTVNMRRQAKGGRVLFHYNGHGVPKPTRNGDIWVFNSNYTQYMPVSVQDIQIWLGSPGIFVYDCSAAGNILENFVKHAKRKDNEWLVAVSQQEERDILAGPPPLAALPHSHSVHFAACRGDENLPLSPHLPADVFTACMTTPIEMAMRWWIMRNNHLTDFNQSAITMVPGVVSSRRTPLGEINWIFTAVTDTIAWNTLSKESFKKLFRQDLLTSTLFRNFMLAVRLMRHYNCHPVSYPELPPTYDHHLWGSFESALDECLIQLPDFINASQNQIHYEYMPSDFFTYQLDSFQTYLGHGAPQQAHPELLPIILQVLLSQLHRNRALSLLVDFLKFGRWAVNQCLAVGIFPYVLKLISSTQTNSRGYLAAIWSAIISVDYSVRQELMRSNAPKYFLDGLLLDNLNLVENTPVTVLACRAHCLMVLTHLCRDLYEAQQVCGMPEIVERLKDLIQPNTVTPLRQWSCLFLAELCRNHVTNIQQVVQLNMHECLFALLEDPIPEVRAAAVMALSAFFGPAEKTEHVVNVELIICIALVGAAQDASPVVRKEIVIALSHYIKRYPERFFTLAMETIQKRPHDFYTGSGLTTTTPSDSGEPITHFLGADLLPYDMCLTIWRTVLRLSVDPVAEVAQLTSIIVDFVTHPLLATITAVAQTPVPISLPSDLTELGSQPSATGITLSTSHPVSPRQRSVSHHTSLTSPTKTNPPPHMGGSVRDALPIGSYRDGRPQRHVPYFEPPVEIPLVSKLLEWQTLLVLEPYLRKPEEQQEGSEEYLASAWRKTRNDAIVAQFQTVRANYRKRAQWSKSTTMTVDQVPNLLHFHHYEKQLVVSDAKQTVSIWDWENKSRLHQISNPLLVPKLPRITTVQLINEMDMGILMVGTHDGTLRFFQNYADPDRCEMITGWQNFTEHVQDRRRPTRMVTEWVQRTGLLYVTGSTNTINVWDLSRELCVKKIHSKSTGIVNAIAVDQVGGNLIFCGGSDGVVRVYDERMDQTRCQARVLGDPTIPGNSVIQTILQGGQGRELVSASTDGKVRLWDVGTGRSRGSLVAHSSGVLNHLAVHDNMPIFATAAANSLTAANGVWDMDFKHIGLFRHSTGILGRVAAVTALAMHQMSPTIAMGNDDSTVTFISPHL
ncbi:raptor N-terminal caspase like domain-containing protein [Dimargaris cristalligena]|uniref:Raptor N-terminal caspase like domain-containing protein n=1 Tax=Dimargaris cristalligena TaxID=215637 RepID=A0A4P9ZM42_9FUNG|nr:raptor N-terminal caspase like domain-containing protein [Dimargaris cristalligena]|eukprot:RKP34188.1 raptor N-terminal caspase like domain-containing protein [Dimargaris cristalligena]